MYEPTPELLEDAKDLLIKHGLRAVRISTDSHVVSVEEPSIWAEGQQIETEVHRIDI
jgi:hypothetical protein